MNVPVCLLCGQPCDVRQVDNSPWNTAGGQSCDVGCTGVSRCCDTPYRMGPVPEKSPGVVNDYAEA